MKNILIATTLLLLLVSCKQYEHVNPFDSTCPKEFWTPANFKAALEGTTVKLTWTQPVTMISGFKVTKKVGDAAESAFSSPGKDILQLSDNDLTGGKLHTYTILAYAGDNQSNSVTVQITPIILAGIMTTAVTMITTISASSGGSITNDGGSPINSRGVCWSTSTGPKTTDSKTTNGTGIGSFTSSVSGLTPGSTYYLRSYAINSAGTAYGNEVIFTALVNLPSVTTSPITSITSTTASSGGIITSSGGGTILAKGVCWSKITGPTIDSNKTTDGLGTGNFTSAVSGLTAGSYYYLRAYATNSAGTAYGNEVNFTTGGVTTIVIDSDGNIYNTVTIGTQVWMASNLKTTKFNDNSVIPLVTDNNQWANLVSSGFCWYNNDPIANKETYGALYNWYTVSSGKLCPTGFHVPSDDNWKTLIDYLGGSSFAGGKLKETGTSHWASPNDDATNITGFTALPGGNRFVNSLGQGFEGLGYYSFLWSSTQYDVTTAWNRVLVYQYSTLSDRGGYNKHNGQSVRCLRD